MEAKRTARTGPDVSQAPLPAERAFVVQLSAQVEPGAALFIGRAEHIVSGAAARFASPEELIAFITDLLAAPAASPDELAPPRRPKGEETT